MVSTATAEGFLFKFKAQNLKFTLLHKAVCPQHRPQVLHPRAAVPGQEDRRGLQDARV